jgi:alcohol dehydrogenase
VFEHVGPDTWPGSLFALKRGGRLVTCGSTTGLQTKMNLFTLFQQQLRIFGSFGCTLANMRDVMDKMARGEVRPVVDSTLTLRDIETGLQRLESRNVFGKIVLNL